MLRKLATPLFCAQTASRINLYRTRAFASIPDENQSTDQKMKESTFAYNISSWFCIPEQVHSYLLGLFKASIWTVE
jgi:hypothetical protein